jgi:hypothetical protein
VRKAVFLAVLAMVAAGALALAGAGSAAKPASGVSATPRATGMHLGPGVVRQIGARNYAGPNCPGVGWNCTTATRVLQIATDGGDNIAQCTGGTASSTGDTQTCAISQGGANNTARCTEHINAPSATQSCLIIQTGAKNTAVVDQMIVATNSANQLSNQTAIVMQGDAVGAATLNSVQITQNVKQNTGSAEDAGFQFQDAFQVATVTQNASGSGKNMSQIDQSENQHAHSQSAIDQEQNGMPALDDCAPGVAGSSPNVCANVKQTAVDGTNTSTLNQSIDEKAKSQNPDVTQFQGWSGGGINGQVHQAVSLTGPGFSTNTAKQSKTQDASAPAGAFQQQFDPVSCCGFASQDGGGDKNSETIHQDANLKASSDLDFVFQEANIFGTSRSGDGSCTFDQHATLNTGSQSNTGTLDPCPIATASMQCQAGESDFSDGIDVVVGDVAPQQEINEPCFVQPPEISD